MYDRTISLVSFSRQYLDKSWEWLNDEEIKKLTGTSNFTKEEQETFFSKLPINNYLIWGVEYSNKKIGVAGLKNIKNNSAEYFGYIGEKQYWNKGLLSSILHLIKQECKKTGINNLYLRVLSDNVMAIKAYEKNGFAIHKEVSDNKFLHMTMRLN